MPTNDRWLRGGGRVEDYFFTKRRVETLSRSPQPGSSYTFALNYLESSRSGGLEVLTVTEAPPLASCLIYAGVRQTYRLIFIERIFCTTKRKAASNSATLVIS